jgi:hypothetical protein
MDPSVLYIIVQLANNEVRTATYFPTGSVAECRKTARTLPRGNFESYYLRAGAKSVRFYCAPGDKTIVIAR